MLISELNNRDEVLSTIIKELNTKGIKIRNEKQKQGNVIDLKKNRKVFSNLLFLITEQTAQQENISCFVASAGVRRWIAFKWFSSSNSEICALSM